jgi:hypothetical protein
MAVEVVEYDTPTPPGTPKSTADHRAARSQAMQEALALTPTGTSPRRTGQLRTLRRRANVHRQSLFAISTPSTPRTGLSLSPRATFSNVVSPRIGGIQTIEGKEYAWCGGGSLAMTVRLEPASMLAYRPLDFKSQAKSEASCQEGLSESHRLSTPDKIAIDKGTTVTLQAWINNIKLTLEERGMDSVFRMREGLQEHYLLEEFGRAEVAKVLAWVATVVSFNCKYDIKNLKMSGKMLKGSLDLEMLQKVERDVPGSASGPEIYAAVINIHQSLSSSAVRHLIEQLQKLKLAKEPAENVETFSEKVLDIAQRIQGTGSVTCPPDLHVIVYETFQGTMTPVFAHEVTTLLFRANEKDPSVLDYEKQISKLKSSYRGLIVRGNWEAAKHHKENAEVQALAATVKTMSETLNQVVQRGGRTDTRHCYHCNKTGHIKPNCPDKNKPKAAMGGGTMTTNSSSSSTTVYPSSIEVAERKTPPKEGEQHTKTDIDGVTCKWCGICKRWSKGEKAHLTEEHIKGQKSITFAAGSLATTTDDANQTLRLVSGFMGSIGQPPKKQSMCYCKVCKKHVSIGEDHVNSVEHAEAEVYDNVDNLWTLVENKKKKKQHELSFGYHKAQGDEKEYWTVDWLSPLTCGQILALKDQAGRR